MLNCRHLQHGLIELAHKLSVPVTGAGPRNRLESNYLRGNDDSDDELCNNNMMYKNVDFTLFALELNTTFCIKQKNHTFI